MKTLTNPQIHALLAGRCEIAVIWGTEDVQSIRPDLTEDQAWDVLQLAENDHDANYGITWLSLEAAADALFGPMPESTDGEEVSHGQ